MAAKRPQTEPNLLRCVRNVRDRLLGWRAQCAALIETLRSNSTEVLSITEVCLRAAGKLMQCADWRLVAAMFGRIRHELDQYLAHRATPSFRLPDRKCGRLVGCTTRKSYRRGDSINFRDAAVVPTNGGQRNLGAS